MFAYKTNFTASCIDGFCHPLGLPLNDQARQSPITTIDRGLYFESTSKLNSTPGWILAPDISFCSYMRVLQDGTIFEAFSSESNIFRIKVASSRLIITILLNSLVISQTFDISMPINTNWLAMIFVHFQRQMLSTLKLGTTTVSNLNFEFRTQDSSMKYYFGSSLGTSFQGFLYKVVFRNSNSSDFSYQNVLNSCGYNTYLFNSQCVPCDPSCTTWPWCIRAICTVCMFTTCDSCNSYGYSGCTSCSNGNPAPDCEKGKWCNNGIRTFDCTTCQSGLQLISGVCVKPPYGGTSGTSPAINIRFTSFTQFYAGIFKSGANESTWGPYNNPDPDDPKPFEVRGLYFDGNSTYLESKVAVVLSPRNTVAFWYNNMNDKILYSSNIFKIYGNLKLYYLLYNIIGNKHITCDSPSPPKYIWAFAVIMLNHNSGLSTITISIQKITYTSLSFDGYALYDTASNPVIGMLRPDYFKGFLLTFTIWQDYGADTLSQSAICGADLILSCVSTCEITEYFNSYQGICLPCDISCTSGCVTWGTCQKCSDIQCDSCDDFTGPCTPNNPSPCIPPLRYSAGKCCHAACGSCYGIYDIQCLSCNNGAYLLGTLCVTECPSFYTPSNRVYNKSITKVLSLIFDQIKDSYTDSTSGIVLSTGIDSSFYPNLKSSDPIPAKNRGYYFLSTSYMYSTTNFILNYNYTLHFWIKHIQPGKLFTKGSVEFSTSMSFVSSNFSFSNANCLINIDWMLLTLQFTTNSQGIFTYYLYSSVNSVMIASDSASLKTIALDSSPMKLGDNGSSFIGFLYRFDIIDYDPTIFSFDYDLCSGSLTTNCLWNCEIDFFYQNNACASCNDCQPCLSNCTTGCIDANSCNLCNNVHCTVCNGFDDRQCTECADGFSLIGADCVSCEIGTYFDVDLRVCKQCKVLCGLCSAANNCDQCMNNSRLDENSDCVCNPGYYHNSTSKDCRKCDGLCELCSASTVCSKCIGNSYLDATYKCICKAGYYYDHSVQACLKCEDLCEICTMWNKCDKCISTSYFNEASKCVCKSGYYFAESVKECIKCGVLCGACTERGCDLCFNNSFLDANLNCVCKDKFYFDSNGYSCLECSNLCASCTGEKSCNSCVTNSHLDPHFECVCELGYHELNNGCTRTYFMVFYDVSPYNDITILFNETLLNTLTISDLEITLNENPVLFTIEEIDSKRYKITLVLPSTINASTEVKILFTRPLISRYNSLLSANSLTVTLNFVEEEKIADEVRKMQTYSKSSTTAAFSASITGSLIKMNPNSFFTFLNCMEIYTYTLLFDLNLTSGLKEFITNSQLNLNLPSIFSYLVSDSDGNQIPKKFKNFGYNSNLIMINSGFSLSVFFFFLLMMPIVFGSKHLSKGWLRDKLQWISNKYKFTIFLRLLIQMFLELSISSFIGILYCKTENRAQITDLIICCLVFGFELLGVIIVICLIAFRGFAPIKGDFLQKFGLLFVETIDENTSQRLYYGLFLIRRLIIGITIFFVHIPVLQLSVNTTLTLGLCFYMIYFRPLKDKISQTYIICNELITALFYIFLLMSFIEDTGINTSYSNTTCIKLLIASSGCNFVANIASFIKSAFNYIRSRKKIKVEFGEVTQISKPNEQIDVFSKPDYA